MTRSLMRSKTRLVVLTEDRESCDCLRSEESSLFSRSEGSPSSFRPEAIMAVSSVVCRMIGLAIGAPTEGLQIIIADCMLKQHRVSMLRPGELDFLLEGDDAPGTRQ